MTTEIKNIEAKRARTIPLYIEYEDKYFGIEYKDWKFLKIWNLELDKASEIFFDKFIESYWVLVLPLINQAIEEERKRIITLLEDEVSD